MVTPNKQNRDPHKMLQTIAIVVTAIATVALAIFAYESLKNTNPPVSESKNSSFQTVTTPSPTPHTESAATALPPSANTPLSNSNTTNSNMSPTPTPKPKPRKRHPTVVQQPYEQCFDENDVEIDCPEEDEP
jgi:hypothetical protein